MALEDAKWKIRQAAAERKFARETARATAPPAPRPTRPPSPSQIDRKLEGLRARREKAWLRGQTTSVKALDVPRALPPLTRFGRPLPSQGFFLGEWLSKRWLGFSRGAWLGLGVVSVGAYLVWQRQKREEEEALKKYRLPGWQAA